MKGEIKQKNILICSEVESKINELQASIQKEGYKTIFVKEIENIFQHTNNNLPDLIIYNLTTSQISELTKCVEIRNKYSGPLFFLSDCTDDMYNILGYEYGLDNIINKPINLPILVAKINSLLRRVDIERESKNQIFELGQFKINQSRREVFFKGELIYITSIEFAILWFLVSNSGKIISRNDLHKVLYNTEYNGYGRSLDQYISRIRTKLNENPKSPSYIKTIRGEGYLFLS